MRVTNGFFIQLIDEYRGKIIFQVATDDVSVEEFARLWEMVGKQFLRQLGERMPEQTPQIELRVRVTKT